MTRPLLRLLHALLVSCAIGHGAEYHPSLPAIGSLDGLGVNIHFTDPQPGELEMIKAAGFKWVRMDFTWAGTEREAGKYDFAAYDRLVAALEKNGLHAVFILDYGNPLYDDALAPHTDTSRAAFAKWAAAAVAHFKGRGFLWEIWNEPNIAQFWKPKPDVQQYIALAKAAAAELRTPNSEIRNEAFIGPACSTIDLPFLEACMKAGLLEFFDAVSVHPYRQTAPETVEEEYRSVRLLIRKYAPPGKTIPVLSGEWGYSTGWKDYDEDKQAKYFARQFLTNIANDVPLSIWYDWRDDGDDPKEPEHHFGIVRAKYRKGEKEVFEPKPAYRAAKTLTTQLAGMRFNKRFVREDEPQWFLLFNRNDQVRAVVWALTRRPISLPGEFHECKVTDLQGETRGLSLGWAAESSPLFFDGLKFVTPKVNTPLLKFATRAPRLPLDLVMPKFPEVEVPMRFENSSNAEINFAIDTETLPFWGGMITWGNSEISGQVKPRRHVDLRVVFRTDSLDAAAKFRFEFSASAGSDREIQFQQLASVHIIGEKSVIIYRPGSDAVKVTIYNPDGEPWHGRAALDYSLEHEVYANDQELGFERGEVEKTLRFELFATPPYDLKRVLQDDMFWKFQAIPDEGDAVFGNELAMSPTADFSSATLLNVALDGDGAVEASAHVIDGHPTDGANPTESPEIGLHYRFAKGWRFARLIGQTHPQRQDEYLPRKNIFLWLHGDGKGCATHIRFVDATGQTFQPDGPRIDWTGWRYVSFPMQSTEEKPLAHWGGANDGEIHYPIKWDTIFLLDNVSREPLEGEVYLSAPTLIY